MSAWVVSKEHIDLLVTAGLDFPPHGKLRWNESSDPDKYVLRELDTSNASEVGGMLWAENYASVENRYPDITTGGSVPGPVGFEATQTLTYTFRRIPGVLDPVVVLKNIACYEYQSCEHEGWKTSQAKRYCESLQHAAINRLRGYNAAPWGFDDRTYFTRLAAEADKQAAAAARVLEARRRAKG